jgi:dTDP-4-dehydrorhamnose reductase
VRIVVTGVEGQVARSLGERGAARNVEVVRIGRPALDLAEPDADVVRRLSPDVLVNAAAYTAVDQAESEPDLAAAINREGAGRIAAVAADLGIPIVHLSTDYVFDGRSPRPYREDDPVGPVSVYGRTKLDGERAVAAAAPDYAILRTAWVYSPFGRNFAKTMLRLAASRDSLSVVDDQIGSPTNALEIADAVLSICENLRARPSDKSLRGVFHLVQAGEATWAAFARAIFAASRELGGPVAEVQPIPTSAYPTPARRPANSRLDCTKLAAAHGVRLPPWPQSLRSTVERILNANGDHR